MSTSSSPLSSLASLTDPSAFSGVSKFASSLQQVLSRSVGIASLPLDADEATLNDITTRQSAVQGLDTIFANLQQSVGSLQSALNSSLLNSSLSNAGVVTANVGQGALPGSYSIEVGSLGAYSTALSTAGSTAVTDPSTQGISTSASFTLTAGGVTNTITPASGSLNDLVSAINSAAGGAVQAAIVNVGSSSAPDYRLSLQAASLGTDPITLTDADGGNLISSSTAGSLASYTIDGTGSAITSTSRTITLAPNVTVNLVGQSTAGQPTTITVSDNAAGIASAFSSFAGSYNAAVDALAQYHGTNAGTLEGDSLVQTLTGVLNQLAGYSNGSAAGSLANYGITVDQTGILSVDTAALTNAASANFPAFLSVLGTSAQSTSAPGGFLQTATNLLNGLEDPTTGIIKNEESDIKNEITAQQTKITAEQARVTQLQTNLTKQVSDADAAIAALESLVSYVTGLFAQFTGASNTQNNGLATL